MRIPPFVYGILVLTIFLGTIFFFQAVGVWFTSGKMTSSGELVAPSAADVNTIKGWMTLQQVSDTFAVPVPEILAAFELPAGTPPTTALKDMESDLFSVTNLRTWLQSRQNP
jgi:hypothetical protein